MITRIDIPEGEDPFFYVMAKAGSPRLLASRNEGWDALYMNDSTLTPREREVARIRSAHAIKCTVCLAARMAELPGFSDEEEIPEEIYTKIIADPDWTGYTVREKLISQFTALYFEDVETLVEDADLWATFRAEFSDVGARRSLHPQRVLVCVGANVGHPWRRSRHLRGGRCRF